MTRRLIPPALALGALVVALTPTVLASTDPRQADTWTLLLAAAVFAFKACLFAWMRQRMVGSTRRLTVFGAALVDFFTALTVLAFVLAVVFSVNFIYATGAELDPPILLRTIDRACIVASGVLVIATGTAAAYEMRRAGAHLMVHDENWDGTSERRTGPADRRMVGS